METKVVGKSMESISVSIPIGELVDNNCTEDNGIGDYSNNEDNQVSSTTTDNMLMEIEGLTRPDEDLNDSANRSIGSVELEDKKIRDQIFFWSFWSRTIQMIVVTALLILAVEWEPLQQLLEKHVKYLGISLGISYISGKLASLKVHQGWCKFLFQMVINMIYKLNIYWFMAALSYKFSIWSAYSIVLAAVTVAAVYLLLTIFVNLKYTNDRDGYIYVFAAVVPILVLLLSPLFYYILKLMGANDLVMSNYLMNVLFGISFAVIVSFVNIAMLQLGGKWFRYKTDANGKIVCENVKSDRTLDANQDATNFAKVTGKKREVEMMNYIYFSEYLSRFLQMVVLLALLILGVKWEPLHQFILRNWISLYLSLLVLGACCAGILFSKFLREKFISMIFIQMVITLKWYYFFANFFPSNWVVLAAVIVTTEYYILAVCFHFKMCIKSKCAIYGYFTIISLILSQLYYLFDEQLPVSMSHQDYTFNVCQIIGMATVIIVIIEFFGWERDYYAGKALQLFPEDSFAVIELHAVGEPDVEPPPVNI